MTLVEVVAGLALLGTLLVLLLLTIASLTRQRMNAETRLAAVAACDHVLSEFHAAGRSLPRSGGGIAGKGLRWQSLVLRRQQFQGMSVDVIRLWVTRELDDKSLAQVEILQAPPGAMK
ncbi:MAG: hypothetical protein JWM57_1097 [Phycisphaerales bacterium]|nr:hypothetical protein [Phycisphaerales bacterium]